MQPGTVIDGKYLIVQKLGQGGMGAVYEARHTGTSRRVAIKVISPEALTSGGDLVERFQREAHASGAIDSQNVVQVLDTGVDPVSKSPYLVMEHLAGEDLITLIERVGPLVPETALKIIAQACAGLARAADAGIVHRDVKSANIFLARRDEGDVIVKLLDFGIAKLRADPLASGGSQSVTRTGSMLGSPLYMSPEQVVGARNIDLRSDIYSLGVTLYEALAGVTPHHESESVGALIIAINAGRGVPLEQRMFGASPELVALVRKATANDPKDRFQTPQDFRRAILQLVPTGPQLHESMLVGSHSPGSVPRFATSTLPLGSVSAQTFGTTTTKDDAPARVSPILLALVAATVALVAIGAFFARGAFIKHAPPEDVPTAASLPPPSASVPEQPPPPAVVSASVPAVWTATPNSTATTPHGPVRVYRPVYRP